MAADPANRRIGLRASKYAILRKTGELRRRPALTGIKGRAAALSRYLAGAGMAGA